MRFKATLVMSVLLAGCSAEPGERSEAEPNATGGATATSGGSAVIQAPPSSETEASVSRGGSPGTDGPAAGQTSDTSPGGAPSAPDAGESDKSQGGAPGGSANATPTGGAAPEPPEPPVLAAPEPLQPEPVAPEPLQPEPVAPEPLQPEPVAPEPLPPVEPELPANTVGTGQVEAPAIGPAPSYGYAGGTAGYVLVKNWDFGADGTIRSISELNEHFQYHDQFKQIANGRGKYGAYTVAPDREHALHDSQPVEGVNTDGPVREFFASSMKTYLVGLSGASEVNPSTAKAGCGSFQAKWKLPAGGSRLGMDLLWETRVRYETPPYFWFALWTSGNKWVHGAEMDLVESFGFDNGDSFTNFDGHAWHSSVVGGTSETNYHAGWSAAMKTYGISGYDASEYHTWTWIYKADDTFESYNDGKIVQRGALPWTVGADAAAAPIDMSFIFDGAWGHTDVDSVDRTLPVSEFAGKFYEWDFSRIYLRPAK